MGKIERINSKMSREEILHLVQKNQPDELPFPDLTPLLENNQEQTILEQQFIRTLEAIGSTRVLNINNLSAIEKELKSSFNDDHKRIITTLPELGNFASPLQMSDPHQLANVEVVICKAQFGVAENGACWVTDAEIVERVLPFITQHLVLVMNKENILATMHQAYPLIKNQNYGFGTFIAGPSKTADIEQSLVIGAHGPRSLTVFLVG